MKHLCSVGPGGDVPSVSYPPGNTPYRLSQANMVHTHMDTSGNGIIDLTLCPVTEYCCWGDREVSALQLLHFSRQHRNFTKCRGFTCSWWK